MPMPRWVDEYDRAAAAAAAAAAGGRGAGAMDSARTVDYGMMAQCVQEAGDVLFVPRGYVHETSTVSDKYLDAPPSEARDTHSIALTLGIETATLSQTFENLLTCLAAKAQWHPAVGLDQAGQAVCVSLWHMLCSHASQWGLAQGVRCHERDGLRAWRAHLRDESATLEWSRAGAPAGTRGD